MANHNEAEFLEELVNSPTEGKNSKDYMANLARKHGLMPYQAENISSFYGQNEGKVKVCRGLPCRLKGEKAGNGMLGGIADEAIEEVSCLGYCDHAPVAWSNGSYYQIGDGGTRELDLHTRNGDFRQVGTLQEYLGSRGFDILLEVLSKSNRAEVLQLVHDFNLKGFGGSGFPTYVKWKAVSEHGEHEKYLIVNAHEGEPGTFKDRILMESNPFELIEGAFLSALVVGATSIVIALKHEYLEAERALQKALLSSKEYLEGEVGGEKLPGMKIVRIPGHYITGEESALMEAIEGKRSEPRLRPPYPADVGLYGKPTLIDNVETLIYFLGRMRDFSRTGRIVAGEKAYCLTGDVKNPGSYRLPYGTSSTELLEKKGGTSITGLKALLPGGLSGGILPAEKGNVNLDFDSVKAYGAGMGTGAMIAISKERCMVDVMEGVESFFERESCGKCMPCRYGTGELSGLFSKLRKGEATSEDIESGKNTADVMLKGSICGLGQASAKMFIDSLKYFSKEIEEHTSGNCPAKICFEGGR